MFISQTGLAYCYMQMTNHMRDSNSEPNKVWKWDLQSMWPEALRSRLSFLSPRKEPLEPGYELTRKYPECSS
jgi:hypothetical protein